MQHKKKKADTLLKSEQICQWLQWKGAEARDCFLKTINKQKSTFQNIRLEVLGKLST